MSWLPTLRLEADGLDPLIFDTYTGWTINGPLDPGFPIIRTVTHDNPDADGSYDTTEFFGARNITFPVQLDRTLSGMTLQQMEDRIKAFLSPHRRAILYGQFEEAGDERRAVVRGANANGLVNCRHYRDMLVQLVCPSGLFEGVDLESVTGAPGDNQPQGGMVFPLTFPLTFGSSTPSTNGVLATNNGNVPVWPTIYLFGPMTDPVVLNETTDLEHVFAGLTIAAGDWVRIDGEAKTIENSTGTSYYDTRDPAASTWWLLEPGDNRIFVIPDTSTIPPASFTVEWRPQWL